jgi:hypothetical protein
VGPNVWQPTSSSPENIAIVEGMLIIRLLSDQQEQS